MADRFNSRYKRLLAIGTLGVFLSIYASAISTGTWFRVRNLDEQTIERVESPAKEVLKELSTHPPANEEEKHAFAAKLSTVEIRHSAPCYDLREAALDQYYLYVRTPTPENLEQLKSLLNWLARDC